VRGLGVGLVEGAYFDFVVLVLVGIYERRCMFSIPSGKS
jgi:hypothetical protein